MRPGAMITAGIGGVIAIIIALVTYPILQSAADTLYLEYVPHCKVGSEAFTRIYAPDSSGVPDYYLGSLTVVQTPDAATCQHPAIEVGTYTGTLVDGAHSFYSEHGERIATITITKPTQRLQGRHQGRHLDGAIPRASAVRWHIHPSAVDSADPLGDRLPRHVSGQSLQVHQRRRRLHSGHRHSDNRHPSGGHHRIVLGADHLSVPSGRLRSLRQWAPLDHGTV